MYVFGNGVVLSVATDSQKTVIEVSIPSYLRKKNSEGRFESSPGKIRLTYWKNGPKIDGLLQYLKENESQIMFTAQESMSQGKDDKWYTNYTGITLDFASVPKKQRPAAQKPAPRAKETDDFQDVNVDDDEDDLGDYEL